MWLKIKVWTKIIVFAAVLLYVILFVAKNSAIEVTPWFFFGAQPKTTALLLAFYAFAAGVILTILLRTTFRTARQFTEMRERQRVERMEKAISEQERKAGMLRTKPDEPEAPAKESMD